MYGGLARVLSGERRHGMPVARERAIQLSYNPYLVMKIHSLNILAVLGGLSLAVATPAFASDAEDMFHRMDLNGDKKVTTAENLQFAEAMFQQSDADRDGKVSVAECESSSAKDGKEVDKQATVTHMRLVDTDGDGQINKVENAAFAKNAFTRGDKNSDGVLTEGEFEEAHQAMKKERKD
jgi:Ca2+-binding EF-hand superfamily protein